MVHLLVERVAKIKRGERGREVVDFLVERVAEREGFD